MQNKQTKINIRVCIQKTTKVSLWKNFLASLFKKENKKVLIEKAKIDTIAEYLESYELKSTKSLGRKYRFRKCVLQIIDSFGKSIRIIWRASLWSLYRLSMVAMMAIVVFSGNGSVLSAPNSVNVATIDDWKKGVVTNVDVSSDTGQIKLKPDGSWNARVWGVPQNDGDYAVGGFADGSSSVKIGDYIYIRRGGGTRIWFSYDIQRDTYEQLPELPFTVLGGADLGFDGNRTVYMTFGGFSKKFYKYDVIDKVFTALDDTLDTIGAGSNVEVSGADIFINRGNGATDFWKFNVTEGSWENLAPMPGGVSGGSSFVLAADGNIYVTRGSTRKEFYRYNTALNNWTTLTNSPDFPRFSGAAMNLDQKGTFFHNSNNNKDYVYYINTWAGTPSSGPDSGIYTRYSFMIRYNITDGIWSTWNELDDAPTTNANYSSMQYNPTDGLIYVIRGDGSYDLWKFNPLGGTVGLGTEGAWVGPQLVNGGQNNTLNASINTGSDLIWNGVTGEGGYLYASRGANTLQFYRFDIAANTWSPLANLPAGINTDVKGTYVNGYIYYLRGNSTNEFYRYDVTANTWSIAGEMANLPVAAYDGAALAYNSADGYIYAIRGGNSNLFYRYNIVLNTWEARASLSSIANGFSSHGTYYGGRLVSDGVNIYAMPGGSDSNFLKYDTGTNSWSSLANTPFIQFYGTDMTLANGKIYALAGWYRDETWEYTINTNSWRKLPPLKEISFGRGSYNGASIEYAGGNSLYATLGQGLAEMLSLTISDDNYINQGTYISQAMDLNQVESWISFTKNDDTPANTDIAYETQSSSDGKNWEEWNLVSGTTINSTPQRYIRVRITLNSSDQINTPTVSDWQIAYNSEDNEPQNPTSITALSRRIGGESLVSGNSYKKVSPYFSWTGASDVGSGVAGYYVYFGTNNEADPVVEGTYQESAFYEVNTALQSGTYYLRIKSKDVNGNITSQAWEAFRYVYVGVSPTIAVTKTSQADFESGENINLSTSATENALGLESINGFWNESRRATLLTSAGNTGELVKTNVDGHTYLFSLAAGNRPNLNRYDPLTDTWTAMANAPANIYYGSDFVAGPEGYLYAATAGVTSTFLRYDIAQNLWETVASAPQNFTYGGTLTYDNNRYIYATPGGDNSFFRYDTENDRWVTLGTLNFGNPEFTYQSVNNGAEASFDGDNTIYMTQGGGYPYFAKYTIENNTDKGEIGGTWTVLAPAPVGINYGGNITYDSESKAIYLLGGWGKNFFYKYDIATDTWSRLPDSPDSITYGSSGVILDNSIYIQNNSYLLRYNIEEGSWDIPLRGVFEPPHYGNGTYYGFSGGAAMAPDGNGKTYITRGGWDNLFSRFDPLTGESEQLAPLPVGAIDGAQIVYVAQENAVYYVAGSNLASRRVSGKCNYFFKYDVATNSWQNLTNDLPPAQINTSGVSLIYDGARYLYLTAAGGGATWWRYDRLADSGSRWMNHLGQLNTTLPSTTGWSQGTASRLLFKDNIIYSTRAQSTNQFYSFNTNTNTWLRLADVPANLSSGSALIDGVDGYLYLTQGGNTSGYFRYKISDNTWETMPSIPAQVSYGGGGAGMLAGNRIWTIAGGGTNTYNDGLYSYVVGTDQIGFKKVGTHISAPIDLIKVYAWANLNLNYVQPDNTLVTVETRTSGNGTEWSEWVAAANERVQGNNHTYSINSPTNNYIQVRLVLSSTDQIFSPTIEDYSINYYQDIVAPANPTAITAYEAADKVVTVNSGTWNNHANPYFEWPADELAGGASDGLGGSGVVGYWVYFGTNPWADAFVDGAYQTATNYIASNMTSGQNYYLLIKAVDDAGMIPATSYNAFNYQFDMTPPNNPTDISVTPTGFTAVDNYAFLWENNISDAHSGVQKIQYRTGGDEADVWFDVPNITDVSITIPNAMHITGAYQSGKNWLYLRVIDNAGNISAPIGQEYYFSANAPSPPENLEVTPAYSTGNSFAFDWDQPAAFIGEASKIKYYYSINTLPNAYNVTETNATFAGPGPFATQKGSNRFYVVAMDEAGNVNYDLYSYIDFTADTSAPGAPVNVQIFDTSDRENAEYSVATKWTPPAGANDDNFEGYVIYRATELNGTYAEVATTSGTAYVDTELESKPYYYYIKAKDNTNNLSIASSIVTIVPTGRYTTPPALIQKPTIKTQSFVATFNWGTSRVASSFVEYGKSISLGETNGQVDSVTDHEVVVNGLSADTKYFYKVKYIDPDGNIGTSEVGNFTTLPPPVVSDFTVTDIKLDSALISWKTNTSATCDLKYGAGSLSNTIEETNGASSHIQRITDLKAETDYQAQVECEDGDLNSFSSDQYNFNTPVKPVASDVKVQNIENVDLPTVLVEYKTNVKATTRVNFKHAEEGTPHHFLTEEKITEHKAELKGLDPAKEYILTIMGTDENGIELEPVEQKITTKSDSRPPEIVINRAVGKVLGRGASSQANLYVKIETNEPTKLKIKYTKGASVSGFDQSTGEDPFNTYHLMTIPAEVGQMYSYKAEVFDEAGNLTNSKVSTIIVEEAKSSASEIIIGTTTKQFGWLSELWNK